MKPFSLPKAFQSLSDEQLTELNEWMDDAKCTYDIIRERLLEKYGIKVSNPTLTRYSQRRFLADEAIDHSDSAKNIRTFIALQNAQPVPYDEAGLAMIQKRAFEAACAPKISVGNLATLQRVFNYKNARADAEHRKQIAERNTAVREQKLALDREKHTANLNSKLKTQNSTLASGADALGPLARNWEDIRKRAQIKFGITPEECARRAELRRTWKNPNSESASAPALTLTPNPPHLESRSDQQHLGNQLEVALGTPFAERTSLSGDQTSGGPYRKAVRHYRCSDFGKPNPPSRNLNIIDLLKDLEKDFAPLHPVKESETTKSEIKTQQSEILDHGKGSFHPCPTSVPEVNSAPPPMPDSGNTLASAEAPC